MATADYVGENALTERVLEFVQQSLNTKDANVCVCVLKAETMDSLYADAAVVACMVNLLPVNSAIQILATDVELSAVQAAHIIGCRLHTAATLTGVHLHLQTVLVLAV